MTVSLVRLHFEENAQTLHGFFNQRLRLWLQRPNLHRRAQLCERVVDLCVVALNVLETAEYSLETVIGFLH